MAQVFFEATGPRSSSSARHLSGLGNKRDGEQVRFGRAAGNIATTSNKHSRDAFAPSGLQKHTTIAPSTLFYSDIEPAGVSPRPAADRELGRPRRQHRQTKKAIEAQELDRALRKRPKISDYTVPSALTAAHAASSLDATGVTHQSATSSPTRATTSTGSVPCDADPKNSPSASLSDFRTTEDQQDLIMQQETPLTTVESDASRSSPAASPPSMSEDMDATRTQEQQHELFAEELKDSSENAAAGGSELSVSIASFYGGNQRSEEQNEASNNSSSTRSTRSLVETVIPALASAPAHPESDTTAIRDTLHRGKQKRSRHSLAEYVWRANSPAGRRSAIDSDNIIESSAGGRTLRKVPGTSHEGKSAVSGLSLAASGTSLDGKSSGPPAPLTARRPRQSAPATLPAASLAPSVNGKGRTISLASRTLRRQSQRHEDSLASSVESTIADSVTSSRMVSRIGETRHPSRSVSVASSDLSSSPSEDLIVDVSEEGLSSSLQPVQTSSPSVGSTTNLHAAKKKRSKKKGFLTAGLYAPDSTIGPSRTVFADLALSVSTDKEAGVSRVFPEPIYFGQTLLTGQRDFVLPETLLRNQEQLRTRVDSRRKPQSFRHINRNQYVSRPKLNGELPLCHCHPSSNCGEDCLNRILQMVCSPKTCPCGASCTNVSLGMRPHAKCDVAWYGARGFGLKTLDDIPQHGLVDEYRGEIINLAEVVRRVNDVYKHTGNFYFLDYDAPAGEVLDGGLRGNITRFANHSCAPNCYIEKWIVCGTDEERTAEYQIGLFALRDIQAGEEITYDYGWSDWTKVRGFVDNPLVDKTPQRCHCGAPTCCGILGGKKITNARDNSNAASSASATPPLSGTTAGSSVLGKRSRKKDRQGISAVTKKRKTVIRPVLLASSSRATAVAPHSRPRAVPASLLREARASSGIAQQPSQRLSLLSRGQPSAQPAATKRASRSSLARDNASSMASIRPTRNRMPTSLLPVVLSTRAAPTAKSNAITVNVDDGSTAGPSATGLNAQRGEAFKEAASTPGQLSSADAGRLLATVLRGDSLPKTSDLPRVTLTPGWAAAFADSEDDASSLASGQKSDQPEDTAEDVAMDDDDRPSEAVPAQSQAGSSTIIQGATPDHRAKRASTLARSVLLDNTLTPSQRLEFGLPSWPLGKPDIGKDGQPVRYNPANRAPKAPIRVKDYPARTRFYTADGRPVDREVVDQLSKERFIYSGEELQAKRLKRKVKNAESARLRRLRKRYEDLVALGETQQAADLAGTEASLFPGASASAILPSSERAPKKAKQTTASTKRQQTRITKPAEAESLAKNRVRRLKQPARRLAEPEDDWEDVAEAATPRQTRAIERSARDTIESSNKVSDAANAVATSPPDTSTAQEESRQEGSGAASPSTSTSDSRKRRIKSSGLSFMDEPLPSGLVGGEGFIPGLPASVAQANGMSHHDARRARNTFLARVRRFIARGKGVQEAVKMASEMVFPGHENTPLALARAKAEAERPVGDDSPQAVNPSSPSVDSRTKPSRSRSGRSSRGGKSADSSAVPSASTAIVDGASKPSDEGVRALPTAAPAANRPRPRKSMPTSTETPSSPVIESADLPSVLKTKTTRSGRVSAPSRYTLEEADL
ncbi:unnamed protein product [Parajaminaea phylloscopi]